MPEIARLCRASPGLRTAVLVVAVWLVRGPLRAAESPHPPQPALPALDWDSSAALVAYFEQMSRPKPFQIEAGEAGEQQRRELREFVLACAGLHPLPERVPLDAHFSETLDHPWCTVRRVAYQLWPDVYATGLLYMPKQFRDRPAPAMLCPHGHWQHGHAHPEVQKRCLNLARLGYVTFSTTQNHYEDLPLGVSHQTLMIWNNIRGLDYLASLPEVDRTRIGAAGASGGGLQTQMLVALDPRLKAATIVGLTCDFRQIMFPDAVHCACNHFPGVLRRTDHPEISSLGLPAAVQYLTMNDWTRRFESDNFSRIQKLYAAHNHQDRVFCRYFPTEHNYDREKREYTYWWMERWLRGLSRPAPEAEPETATLPVETLLNLAASVPGNKGFSQISQLYQAARGYRLPELNTVDEYRRYRQRMRATLRELLGEQAVLPRQAAALAGEPLRTAELRLQRIAYPSEDRLLVPAILLAPAATEGRLPVTILLSGEGKEALLDESGPDSPRHWAARGALVVLPDVRTCGQLFATGAAESARQRQAWERNGIVWGRPVPGMAATDLRALLDGLIGREDVDPERVKIVVRDSGDLAAAALFAMALDPRLRSADLDFAGASFANRRLALVSNVLQHGDIIAWAGTVAERQLILRNVPPDAGDANWLRRAGELAGNAGGVTVRPPP